MSSALHGLQITPFRSGPATNPDPARIAVFQALDLGDLLCVTPALRAIRRRFAAAEIVLIGRPWARDFVERLPAVDRFMLFPGFPGIAESASDAELRMAVWPPFDLAIQMHGSGAISNGFVATLGAARLLGYGPAGDDRLTTRLDWGEDEAEPLRWLRLVAAIGATADGLHLEFPLSVADRQRAAALLGPADGRPLIGLHVGDADPARRWPAASFAALADLLVMQLDARIILTGDETDRPLTTSVQRAMTSAATDLAGMTTLGQFAAVISSLNLLVTNDTGASHVATATRTSSVILFGPSRPERWAPLDLTRHHIVDAQALVQPAAGGAAALRALAPALVAARCRAALKEAQLFAGRELARERIA